MTCLVCEAIFLNDWQLRYESVNLECFWVGDFEAKGIRRLMMSTMILILILIITNSLVMVNNS